MKFALVIVSLVALLGSVLAQNEASVEQAPQPGQRILRRVIKSTPTATNLARIKMVQVRSASPEKGVVTEISGKEAANFGRRGNAVAAALVASPEVIAPAQIKSKQHPTTSSTTSAPTTSTTSTTTTVPTTSAAPSTTTTSNSISVARSSSQETISKHKASDRQQQGVEVDLLSSAPSSWQTMTAVEAPAAMLIAAGTRAAQPSVSDLSVAASRNEESSSSDFLRASSSTKGASYTSQSVGETFSRLRQQGTKQQAYFYPQQTKTASKTSSQSTKTHWYQPTTPRPAPLVQEQYEQKSDYVEQQQQQQQVEYGAAPLGQAEPFAFDFKTQDSSGNGQYRKEESDKNGVVRGSYGYTDANGIYRHVEYVADQNGFRANIKSNEPGLNGETQPASIQLAASGSPVAAGNQNQRLLSSENVNNGGEWSGTSSENQSGSSQAENIALAPPDFESSHKAERIREPRHFRN